MVHAMLLKLWCANVSPKDIVEIEILIHQNLIFNADDKIVGFNKDLKSPSEYLWIFPKALKLSPELEKQREIAKTRDPNDCSSNWT